MTRWGVAATVAEPPALLAAFVAHYLSLGADPVRLYLDRPEPEAEALLSGLPGVELIRADAAFYLRTLGRRRRPDHLNRRQRMNIDHAYATLPVDWLLHVDADEFLAAPEFVARLDVQPPEVDSLRIANGERAWLAGPPPRTIFEGVLRWQVPGPRPAVRARLGPEVMRFTDRGFCGHALGKSVTRTGRGLRLGLHAPRREPVAQIAEMPDARIVHFDGLTRAHWCAKLMRYAEQGLYDAARPAQRFRAAQIAHVTEAGGRAAAEALHDRLRVLGAAEAEALQAESLLEPMPCDPAGAARALFGEGLDLSPEAFDRALGLA
ncbi:glycosyltransferase family 2 protein [Roseivivax sp.]